MFCPWFWFLLAAGVQYCHDVVLRFVVVVVVVGAHEIQLREWTAKNSQSKAISRRAGIVPNLDLVSIFGIIVREKYKPIKTVRSDRQFDFGLIFNPFIASFRPSW